MKRPVRSFVLFTLILTLSASNILSAKPRKRPFKERYTNIDQNEDTEEVSLSEELQKPEEIQSEEPVFKPEIVPEKEEIIKTDENIAPENEIEDEISDEPYLKERSWYIYKKTAKKIAAGPFDNVEQALEAWIQTPKFKSKKGFFIGRDGILYTDSPDTYYSRKYEKIKNEIEERKNPEKSVPPADDEIIIENTEESLNENPETSNIEKDPETESNESSEPSKEEIFQKESVKDLSFSVPEFTPQSEIPVFTGNDFQKSYLSDFITKEVFELPDSDFSDLSEEFIEDPNETDSRGVSLLMKAAKEGNDWKIRTLLNAGAQVNARDKDGWTPLMYAVRYQSNLSVLDLLLSKNAEIKTTNNFSLSPLIIAACFNDNPDIIKRLLTFYSPSDKEVQKAFVQLISTQQPDYFSLLSKVKLFLDFGLPVNSYYEGKTPLMYACKYCSSTKVIKLLLDKNAAVTVRSTEGKTAFDYAQTNKTLPRDEIYWSLNKR